jgi:hypothetical protein
MVKKAHTTPDTRFADLLQAEGPEQAQEQTTKVGDVINLNEVGDSPNYEPVPPGTYPAVLEDAEFRMSQSSGNPMITWQFAVKDGEYARRKFFLHTVLNHPVGLQRIKRLVVVLDPNFDLTAFHPKTSPQTLVGASCRLRVVVRKQGGEARNDVADVLPYEAESFLGA